MELAFSISEAARLVGLGRTSLYAAISRGELAIRKCGRRSLVLSEDLKNWVTRLPSPDQKDRIK